MKYIDLSLPTPPENLACDEALLDFCEADPEAEFLRFWEAREPFVVVGYANRADREVNLDYCATKGIGVFRRCSGGGTVLQAPGCLNYSLLLRIPESGPRRTISGTNVSILQRHQEALEPLLKRPVQIQGHTDLTVGDLKFSGNAQRRKRNSLIFHGTFLLNADLSMMDGVLRPPSQQPAYRRNRRHNDFLANLNLPPAAVKSALQEIWHARESASEIPARQIQELARDKYSSAGWNLKF